MKETERDGKGMLGSLETKLYFFYSKNILFKKYKVKFFICSRKKTHYIRFYFLEQIKIITLYFLNKPKNLENSLFYYFASLRPFPSLLPYPY